jgi:hypothetical protein
MSADFGVVLAASKQPRMVLPLLILHENEGALARCTALRPWLVVLSDQRLYRKGREGLAKFAEEKQIPHRLKPDSE